MSTETCPDPAVSGVAKQDYACVQCTYKSEHTCPQCLFYGPNVEGIVGAFGFSRNMEAAHNSPLVQKALGPDQQNKLFLQQFLQGEYQKSRAEVNRQMSAAKQNQSYRPVDVEIKRPVLPNPHNVSNWTRARRIDELLRQYGNP